MVGWMLCDVTALSLGKRKRVLKIGEEKGEREREREREERERERERERQTDRQTDRGRENEIHMK